MAMIKSLNTVEAASALGITNAIPDFVVDSVSTATDPRDHSLFYIQKKYWNHDIEKKIAGLKRCLIIIDNAIDTGEAGFDGNHAVLAVENARLAFAKILKFAVSRDQDERPYHIVENGVAVGENVVIGQDVRIEPLATIEHDVRIGDHATIRTGARILKRTSIGNHTVIGANAVIGGQGFGLEKDETGAYIRIPHLGGVSIGHHVEIGALTTVVAGVVDSTTVEDNVFIDDLCHIAHNCKIGTGTAIAGKVELGGSVSIGQDCFIAPNASIRNGTCVGDHCFIGQGANVTKDIPEETTVAGNPAEALDDYRLGRQIYREALAHRSKER
ncbi:MAG: hypothetical protein LBT52_04820 [Clostridiales Family XIII bacterium]|jgi:UDP-3-O-[3-hydroxymyristoyl] glucosamine N-acyltransferase|nr:hypothetical protein [Clostridiales Family XIII bacterium]